MFAPWREYFTPEELEIAYERIQRGDEDEPEEEEGRRASLTGSESDPSDDNLEKEELYMNLFAP